MSYCYVIGWWDICVHVQLNSHAYWHEVWVVFPRIQHFKLVFGDAVTNFPQFDRSCCSDSLKLFWTYCTRKCETPNYISVQNLYFWVGPGQKLNFTSIFTVGEIFIVVPPPLMISYNRSCCCFIVVNSCLPNKYICGYDTSHLVFLIISLFMIAYRILSPKWWRNWNLKREANLWFRWQRSIWVNEQCALPFWPIKDPIRLSFEVRSRYAVSLLS